MKDDREISSLKVNRNLLDSKFEGYRLSSQEATVSSRPLFAPIADLTLEDKQLYSYLHYSAFNYNSNYLFADTFSNQSICFLADCNSSIWLAKVNINHELDELKCVLKLITFLKDGSSRSSNDCLLTLSFFSSNRAILLFSRSVPENQTGQELILFVINTGDRNSGEVWSIIEQINLLDEKELTNHLMRKEANYTFLTCPARLLTCYQDEANLSLEVIILCVIKDENEKFISLLSWLTLNGQSKLSEEKKEGLKLTRLKQLQSNSYPYYIGIDEGQNLSIISENNFEFTFDSNLGPLVRQQEVDVEISEQAEEGSKYFYIYYQNDKEVTIDFKLIKESESKDIFIEFKRSEILIKIKDENILNGQLMYDVDVDGCTWSIDRSSSLVQDCNILQVSLSKASTQFWPKVFQNLNKGFEIMDLNLKEVYRGLSLLESNIIASSSSAAAEAAITMDDSKNIEPRYIPSLKEIEHCDNVCQDLTFLRLNADSKQVTHHINLVGHQWLFTCNSNLKTLPAFAIRHDVDALIWQPQLDLYQNVFKVDHVSTFPALGYVQASKPGKRFINVSLDYNYAYIADASNHVYLYQKPCQESSLKNRKGGGMVKIGKQQVISLNQEKQTILGCVAYHHVLLLVTSSHLYCIRLEF